MTDVMSFQCAVCQKSFISKLKLRQHGYAHDTSEEKCDVCEQVFKNKVKLVSHKRIHGKKETRSVTKCDLCPYEAKASNLKRHKQTSHNLKCDDCGMTILNKKEMHAHKRQKHHSLSCVVCGLSFTRCDNLNDHLRTHQEPVHEPKKESEFCCEQCGFKTKRRNNLKRHMAAIHKVVPQKKRTTRQKKYRARVKFMKDVENANFVKKKAASGEEALVETDIEQIMAARPNMSNRDVASFLRILKKKLPPKTFSLNIKKALQKRTNLLKAYFKTEEAQLIGKDGEEITMPVTVASDLNSLIKMVCATRGIDEDRSTVVLGVDGGQGKLIITASIIPHDEKEKKERVKETHEKDRLKSTGVKRTLIVARVDDIPECYENLSIIMERLKLKDVKKEFSLVCDIKLIDILVGLQGCSSMYPCPYCLGCKLDDEGKPTNQRGTFQKGEPRTFKNTREQFQRSNTKHKNGKLPSKKTLKNFYSVKHLPMQVTKEMEGTPISKIYPPPQLHTGILGPANDCLKKLQQIFPAEMEKFKKDRHIKGSGPGGDYNGPTLKSIMANTNGKLDDIENIIKEKGKGGEIRFVHHLRNLNELNKVVNLKVLDLPKVKEIIANLSDNFIKMQQEFSLSQTLKLHIIMDHYVDHFNMTQESLLKYSDEICEAMHSQYRIFEERHGYRNNNKNSDTHKKMQHKSMIHINSLNWGNA